MAIVGALMRALPQSILHLNRRMRDSEGLEDLSYPPPQIARIAKRHSLHSNHMRRQNMALSVLGPDVCVMCVTYAGHVSDHLFHLSDRNVRRGALQQDDKRFLETASNIP